VGASDLAEITTTALSNLLVAVDKAELANVVVAQADLSGSAYAHGGANINTALDDLERETKRGAVRLEPVWLPRGTRYTTSCRPGFSNPCLI